MTSFISKIVEGDVSSLAKLASSKITENAMESILNRKLITERKIGEVKNAKKKSVIYKEDDEFVVKFFEGGRYLKNADYFTDDKKDAEDTAKSWLKEELDA